MRESTTRRHLHFLGFNGRQARKTPFVSDKNKKRRMHWAREIRSKKIACWKKVVFTDESAEKWLACGTFATVKTRKTLIMV